MKKYLPNILIAVFLIGGLGLMLYPSISDYINKLHATKAINGYMEQAAGMDSEEKKRILESAEEYNRKLSERPWNLELTDEAEIREYENQLHIDDSGMMGYINIQKIGCYLPIYHGTETGVLSKNIGHIEGSSLPVGGESSHCVLSGHRGLPSAKLFTDLEQMIVGDTFEIHILDETLTYEVDQILTVLPYEISALAIENGKDYCTLVTCTPYGINSHRMLVRGHRIGNAEEGSISVPGDAMMIKSTTAAPIVAIPLLILFFMITMIRTRKKR